MRCTMKYAFLIAALLLLAACTPTAEETIQPPADIPPEEDTTAPEETPNETADQPETEASGTHILCENGECRNVNGCPQGYDEFMAQIGPACVQHYGQEEIGTWPVCKFSNDNCSCTYVSRDTEGTQLTWDTLDEGLRCAPDNYRDYMVHNGLSGVDENGEEYAMIA